MGNNEFVKERLIVAIVLVLLIAGMAYISATEGFGPRCKRAGYEGAELEKCVMRLNEGVLPSDWREKYQEQMRNQKERK